MRSTIEKPRSLILPVLSLLLPVLLFATTGAVTQSFTFAPGDFVFDKVKGYDVVALPGHYSTSEPGKPNLPLAIYRVLIPPDEVAVGFGIALQAPENQLRIVLHTRTPSPYKGLVLVHFVFNCSSQ